jgi:hypothetical protein
LFCLLDTADEMPVGREKWTRITIKENSLLSADGWMIVATLTEKKKIQITDGEDV